ncbi:histidine--tRNA ligase [Chlorobium sp.]|uniref:histidine--tRNA ligase n=1 Tax=Chlorobium sp. TaxID=1095 RepID=UPI002F420426
MSSYQVVKGARDIFPDEMVQWKYVEEVIRRLAGVFGFSEIRTPVFEYTELFQRSIGASTDIVGKEMFTFCPDGSERSITLRPEMTAGVMRAVLQKNLLVSAPVQKLYYISELFRKERPQAGRQRQFTQFGAELLGASSPAAVAEVIMFMMQVFGELGLSGLRLRINSLGSADDRRMYREELRSYLAPHYGMLDQASRERFEKNPLRILDSKNPDMQEIVSGAPKLHEHLGDEARRDFDQVLGYLAGRGIDFSIDHLLVRGLDYYSYTAFEVSCTALGAQDALGGGGRYDSLALELGSPKEVPAAGFAVGMERLLIAMQKQRLLPEAVPPGPEVFIIVPQQEYFDQAFDIAARLRSAGVGTTIDLAGRSMKAQLREANRMRAASALFVGGDEIASGLFPLKDLASSTQEALSLDAVIGRLRHASIIKTQQP